MQRVLGFLKQYKYALVVVFLLISVGPAIAQITTDPTPATPSKIWEVVLKVLFPVIWTAGAPWFTALVTKGINNVPTQVKVVISSVAAAVVAGIAGSIPEFPLAIESAMEMGASQGAAGQILADTHKSSFVLKPSAPTVVPTT